MKVKNQFEIESATAYFDSIAQAIGEFIVLYTHATNTNNYRALDTSNR